MSVDNIYIEKHSEYIINRARLLNSSLIADAMNGENVMSYNMKPVNDQMKVVGTAVTIELEPGDNLYLHKAIYKGGPGYVLVVDGRSYEKSAYLGDLMAAAAKAVGLEGIVIDGFVRDKKDLIDLGFPVFSKGFLPAGPTKEHSGTFNKVIKCGDVNVKPGDLIVGDSDGIVSIPKEKVKDILKKAERKQAYEVERQEIISQYNKQKLNGDFKVKLEPDWLNDDS